MCFLTSFNSHQRDKVVPCRAAPCKAKRHVEFLGFTLAFIRIYKSW
jgi:hypothetical protein